MNNIHLVTALAATTVCAPSAFLQAQPQTTWQINSLTNIGGHATTVVGDPTVVDTPFGVGMLFDGNDGLIIDDNPIAGAGSFTLEMIFRPDPIVMPSSSEPRVFHVQSTGNDHRAILEIRISQNQWYPDAFLRSASVTNAAQDVSLALIDPALESPLGEWYNYSMVYDETEMRAYLDGELLFSGPIAVAPLSLGQVSLGMRHSVERFFEGVISQVRFTRSALDPADFLVIPIVPPEIIDVDYDAASATVQLIWTSVPERSYTIERASDLTAWIEIGEEVGSAGPTTMFMDDEIPAGSPRFFYRVRDN